MFPHAHEEGTEREFACERSEQSQDNHFYLLECRFHYWPVICGIIRVFMQNKPLSAPMEIANFCLPVWFPGGRHFVHIRTLQEQRLQPATQSNNNTHCKFANAIVSKYFSSSARGGGGGAPLVLAGHTAFICVRLTFTQPFRNFSTFLPNVREQNINASTSPECLHVESPDHVPGTRTQIITRTRQRFPSSQCPCSAKYSAALGWVRALCIPGVHSVSYCFHPSHGGRIFGSFVSSCDFLSLAPYTLCIVMAENGLPEISKHSAHLFGRDFGII